MPVDNDFKHLTTSRLWALGDQVPWQALAAVCDALEEGRTGKYKDDPLLWRTQRAPIHWTHAYDHYAAIMEGAGMPPLGEDHVSHFACRALMATEQLIG